MLEPGTILQSRYQVMRLLAQGGMGAVYLAKDDRLGSTVALKETFFTDERLRKAFEREARILANLRHAVIPKVIDHFGENEGQFLVMEYIRGDDLGVILEKRRERVEPMGKPKPFSVDEVIAWAEQLLDALDYLHTRQPPIVHRDIKPQNLKLAERGQIVLLDFGLAKGALLQMSRMTSSGSIFGYTPSYAPLEQIQGGGTDARSDIYSLAATLYHLLTGIAPIDALTRATAVLTEEADPLMLASELEQQVPPSIAAVLMRAMAQNRNLRPPSAAEMREELLRAARTPVKRVDPSNKTTIINPTPVIPPLLKQGEPIVQVERKVISDPTPQETRSQDEKRFAFGLDPATQLDPALMQMRKPESPPAAAAHTSDLASDYKESVGSGRKPVSLKVWLVIIVAVILLGTVAIITGLIGLNEKGPAQVSTPATLTNTPSVSMVEAASYYLQLEQTDGGPALATGFDPLPGNQKYKLHFTPQQSGYLYIIALGTRRLPTTYLTSIPSPSTGVRTNRVEAGTDFEFPAGDNWLRVRDDMDTTRLTVLFSPDPLEEPFLKAAAGQKLSANEYQRLDLLATRAQAELASDRAVIKSAQLAERKPFMFDLRIKRK